MISIWPTLNLVLTGCVYSTDKAWAADRDPSSARRGMILRRSQSLAKFFHISNSLLWSFWEWFLFQNTEIKNSILRVKVEGTCSDSLMLKRDKNKTILCILIVDGELVIFVENSAASCQLGPPVQLNTDWSQYLPRTLFKYISILIGPRSDHCLISN